jgi:WASH complex subunit 7
MCLFRKVTAFSKFLFM